MLQPITEGAPTDTGTQCLLPAIAAYSTGYIEADPVVLEDGSECGDALDLGTELDQTPIDMTALIDHLWHAEQRAAGAAR